MAHYMSEKQVLRKLDIPDWRHMTKDKVIKFASMLHKMDPEVAKMALEQFPNFTDLATEMVIHYNHIIEKVLDSNATGSQYYYDTCNGIIETLKEELRNPNLTFDERQWVISQMIELSRDIRMQNNEDKNFWIKLVGGVTAFFALLAVIAAAILGAGSNGDGDSFDD